MISFWLVSVTSFWFKLCFDVWCFQPSNIIKRKDGEDYRLTVKAKKKTSLKMQSVSLQCFVHKARDFSFLLRFLELTNTYCFWGLLAGSGVSATRNYWHLSGDWEFSNGSLWFHSQCEFTYSVLQARINQLRVINLWSLEITMDRNLFSKWSNRNIILTNQTRTRIIPTSSAGSCTMIDCLETFRATSLLSSNWCIFDSRFQLPVSRMLSKSINSASMNWPEFLQSVARSFSKWN